MVKLCPCVWCGEREATGWDNWSRFKICEECSKRTDVYGVPVDYSLFVAPPDSAGKEREPGELFLNADKDAAERIALAILRDVTDRRGWRQEWDQFDDDVRRELAETWVKLIRQAMQKEREP
jgi:hypothetical protein